MSSLEVACQKTRILIDAIEDLKARRHRLNALAGTDIPTSTTLKYAAVDLRLAIICAARTSPDVLLYITQDFPFLVNPENTSDAERVADMLREAPNLVGLWELSRRGAKWQLQLVCPNGWSKPVSGVLDLDIEG